jgi:galactonate dehydratase
MNNSAAVRSSHVSRRQWIGAGAAAAAGLGTLQEAVAQENNPAANVADRGADLKISALRGWRVGTKAYIKIETNKGIFGWGEVTGLDPNVAVALAQSLFELLDGENPTRIEYLWQKLYRSHRDMRGGPFMTHVIAAIDVALWDITGKAWGVPVYRLLGGPVRDKVRVYPSAKAHKAGTGGPHPFSGTPQEVEGLVNMVKQTRERLGKDAAIMFDAHCAVPPPMLIQVANALEPLDLLFIEEVAVPGNIEVFKRIKQHVRIPIAVGERDRTIWGMIPYLHQRCVDILQPDCAHTGGITQVKKIATLAEAYFVPLAPHCTCSELGTTASLHAACSVPLFLIHEMYLDGHIMPPGVANITWKVDENGYAGLPQEPGLGVTVDESQFEKVNADPKRKFRWPTPKASDGSVIDY